MVSLKIHARERRNEILILDDLTTVLIDDSGGFRQNRGKSHNVSQVPWSIQSRSANVKWLKDITLSTCRVEARSVYNQNVRVVCFVMWAFIPL